MSFKADKANLFLGIIYSVIITIYTCVAMYLIIYKRQRKELFIISILSFMMLAQLSKLVYKSMTLAVDLQITSQSLVFWIFY